MIDSGHLKRLLLIAAALLLASAGASLAFGAGSAFAGGLGVGGFLGALPFASWTWIVSKAMGSRRGRWLALLLLAGKLAIYSGVLYLSMMRLRLSPPGVLAGMMLVTFVLVCGSFWPLPRTAKEAP